MSEGASDLSEKILLKDQDLKESLKTNAPLLYWATQYHRNIRGDRMTFKDRPYLIVLYRDFLKFHKLAVIKPVQHGLSELFIIASFYEAAELGYVVMYVLPKYRGRDRFVNSRIDTLLRKVPAYGKLVNEAAGTSRVSLKQMGRGQILYVGSNMEDEFVEAPIDSAFVDEKDRCNQKNLLLLPDRYSASPHKFHREISTPTIEGRGIDGRIQISTKGRWTIKCEACNHYFYPGFFETVVKQVEEKKWVVRDERCGEFDEPRVICPKCGRPVNRFSKGEYVEEFPGREWVGRIVAPTVSPTVSLRELVNTWNDSCTNPQKKEFFYNSRLGLPYTSEGAKFSSGLLTAVQEPYQYPVGHEDIHGPLFMGVDVGDVLTVVIRERVRDSHGMLVHRLVFATELPSFTLLKELLKEWNPKVCVIDADPEIHNIASLKGEFKNVYSSRFQHGLLEFRINREGRVLNEDRTAAIDSLKSSFEAHSVMNPEGSEVLVGGRYWSQMQASTRVLVVNENNPEKSYYSWEENSPDHFMLAETYCNQALRLIPGESFLDYYAQFAAANTAPIAKDTSVGGGVVSNTLNDAEALAAITPEQFLERLRRG